MPGLKPLPDAQSLQAAPRARAQGQYALPCRCVLVVGGLFGVCRLVRRCLRGLGPYRKAAICQRQRSQRCRIAPPHHGHIVSWKVLRARRTAGFGFGCHARHPASFGVQRLVCSVRARVGGQTAKFCTINMQAPFAVIKIYANAPKGPGTKK